MPRSSPPPPAAPRTPRIAERLSPEVEADIDPDFPDLDGVGLDGVDLTFPDASTLTVLRSRLTRCRLGGDTDQRVDAADAEFVEVDLTGRRFEGLTRTTFHRCRLGGADFGEVRLRDVRFDDCVLDLASFRKATLEGVHVSGGRMEGLDLTGARLTDVTITDAELIDVALDGVRLERVDLTGAGLDGLVEIGVIRGATISEVQAIALAGRLARAAGIHVARDDVDAVPR